MDVLEVKSAPKRVLNFKLCSTYCLCHFVECACGCGDIPWPVLCFKQMWFQSNTKRIYETLLLSFHFVLSTPFLRKTGNFQASQLNFPPSFLRSTCCSCKKFHEIGKLYSSTLYMMFGDFLKKFNRPMIKVTWSFITAACQQLTSFFGIMYYEVFMLNCSVPIPDHMELLNAILLYAILVILIDIWRMAKLLQGLGTS